MCGICGIFRFDAAPVEEAWVPGMVSALAHRGPDALLDPDLIDFAVNLPYDRKVRQREGKWVLIPRSVLYRQERGFNIPGRQYLRLDEAFFRDGFWEREFGFNPTRIEHLAPRANGGFWYASPVTEI